MRKFNTFKDAIDVARAMFPRQPVHTERWQGIDISARPEMAMHEVLFYSFRVPVMTEGLGTHQIDIKPNLPWADNHFAERVCGYPINPGLEWENWPYAGSARKFLEADGGAYNHNYMERYWPRRAGMVCVPTETALDWQDKDTLKRPEHVGIRHEYGDLAGVVRVLARESDTRQAYFPVWFPEDTGDSHNGRKPCTLGYHFIMRDQKLHCVYYIRSCDFVRHFRDDIYLTVRLMLWVLNECRKLNAGWENVKPGELVMHITSLHMFRNDYLAMTGGQ